MHVYIVVIYVECGYIKFWTTKKYYIFAKFFLVRRVIFSVIENSRKEVWNGYNR